MKKFLGILVLGLLWCNFINAANANIYWVYEFYKISPQFFLLVLLKLLHHYKGRSVAR